MRGWKMVSVLLVLLFTASTSFAAGFRLPEAGAKAMGMGFAFTAQADDPSAIYFNPAGLTQLKGQNVMLGVTYVQENGGGVHRDDAADRRGCQRARPRSRSTSSSRMRTTRRPPPTGILPMASGSSRRSGWGRSTNNKNTSIFRNQITKIDLQTVVVNPTIAFKINESFPWARGSTACTGRRSLKRRPWPPSATSTIRHSSQTGGDGDAWGYNFGLLLKPTENFRIGVNYRSPFTLKIKDADVTISNTNPAYASGLLGANPVKYERERHHRDARHLRPRRRVHDGQADGGGGRGLDVLAQLHRVSRSPSRITVPTLPQYQHPEDNGKMSSLSASGWSTG